jgi:hypothetical protein
MGQASQAAAPSRTVAKEGWYAQVLIARRSARDEAGLLAR